jgi:hypothetical protein
MNEFQGLFHQPHCLLLFTVVSALHHKRVNESFDYWGVHFLEASLLISPSGEWMENLSLSGFDVQVGHEGNVFAFNALVRPFSKEFRFCCIINFVIFYLCISVYDS